jgi:hypothetical protein
MFSKRLDKTDLEELRKRTELINQHVLISQALETQKQQFLLNRFSKYRLDITQEYDIDLKTGKITEAKKPHK